MKILQTSLGFQFLQLVKTNILGNSLVPRCSSQCKILPDFSVDTKQYCSRLQWHVFQQRHCDSRSFTFQTRNQHLDLEERFHNHIDFAYKFAVNASGTPPSPPRAGHTAVLLPDNRMMIFGGTVILYDYNTIYMYDCNTDSWIDGYPDKVQGDVHENFNNLRRISATKTCRRYDGS